MSRFNAFPDAEAVVAQAIRDAEIEGLEGRVYSSIPKTPTYPLAVVQRVGGIPAVRQYLDRANIQISVWGNNKGEAHDAAQRARIAVLDTEGTTVHGKQDAFISGVDDSLGLAWIPDPDTSKDRYIFGLWVALRTAAPAGS